MAHNIPVREKAHTWQRGAARWVRLYRDIMHVARENQGLTHQDKNDPRMSILTNGALAAGSRQLRPSQGQVLYVRHAAARKAPAAHDRMRPQKLIHRAS